MQLPTSTRLAVVQRVQAVLGPDRPAPKTWADLNLTERLQIGASDPELAQILQDQMPPALELAVLNGELPAVAPAVKTAQELQAEQNAAAWEIYLEGRQQRQQVRQQVRDEQEAQLPDLLLQSARSAQAHARAQAAAQ